jgi:quercetin dioxygenase-like cupin family protein
MPKCRITRKADCQPQTQEWGCLTWFASGAMKTSDHQTVGLCEIKLGQANPRHHHPNCEEVLHVLQGEIEHDIEDGKRVRLGPGDTISVPAGVVHQARNVGPDLAVLFVCFSSPNRQVQGE